MRPVKHIEQSIKQLTVESGDRIHNRILGDLVNRLDATQGQPIGKETHVKRFITVTGVGKLAFACLFICACVTCVLLLRRVVDLEQQLERTQARPPVTVPESDDSATINLYLHSHQDVVARYASRNAAEPKPLAMHVNPQDVLYYEFLDNEPGYTNPGIIVRGPASQRQISPSKAPVISNGHTLTLSQARETAGFALRARTRLHPGYALDQIRRIDGHDALHLLYTDGINSVSLFEQPLDGRHGLEAKHFREYAVYRSTEQSAATILGWKDETLSYVLIGNIDMSQLMNLAQAISTGK